MEFLFMDESGKGLISDSGQKVLIFGGMIMDSGAVYDFLIEYKKVYQAARAYLQKLMRKEFKELPPEEKAKRMYSMLNQFEIHAVEIFNPKKEKKKENPWKYANAQGIFKTVNDILIAMNPFIENIFMFKVDKQDVIDYYQRNGIQATDTAVVEKMIDYIIIEYHEWLKGKGEKGALILDRLDSGIRDMFVEKIHQFNSGEFWTEPIIVDSCSNAFTQVIDLITYCYYLIYTNAKHKDNFKAIQRSYYKYLDSKIIEKDLVKNFLENN